MTFTYTIKVTADAPEELAAMGVVHKQLKEQVLALQSNGLLPDGGVRWVLEGGKALAMTAAPPQEPPAPGPEASIS